MRRLPLNLLDLESAMEFDSDILLEPQVPYLDLHTGQVIWVWESDEAFTETTNAEPAENRRNRETIQTQLDRFVEIPELDTADDNEILRDFLGSDWTDDDARWRRANEAYRGSVGRWKEAVRHDPTIIHAWHEFEQQAVRRRALAFLAEHGIEPTASTRVDRS